MADASVTFDVFEPFDVCSDFSFQISFDQNSFDHDANFILFVQREVGGFATAIDTRLVQNFAGSRNADAVEASESDLQSFFIWHRDS